MINRPTVAPAIIDHVINPVRIELMIWTRSSLLRKNVNHLSEMFITESRPADTSDSAVVPLSLEDFSTGLNSARLYLKD